MAIMDRDTWSETSKQFAKDLTFYVKECWKIKVMQISGKIKPYHMKKDRVHLNTLGYQVFMDRAVGNVLMSYYKKYIHKKIFSQNLESFKWEQTVTN